jgi:hypothetical protein
VASDTFYVSSGVREGSIFEPLLRNVSVHILPNTIKYSRYLLLILADDIKIFPSVIFLQVTVNRIYEYQSFL